MKSRNSSDEPRPEIPDHELLGIIGQGSYGKIWMARSATGALRAVKVMRREDFPTGSSFEREFEGIRHFEPISREHPALIDVLQVGRNDEEHYYYYIMELADDFERGTDIDPDNYRCDALGTRLRERGAEELEFCVKEAERLADALDFLHQKGLIHRDIKPGNIVFVNGHSHLADIGLVTMEGDDAFVGTEGYVPPEGPGTARADLFSLGMVVYEMSTGKDRLDFPDVPTDIGERGDRALWRRINQAVCRACSMRAENRYSGVREFSDAITGKEEAIKKSRRPILLGAVAILAVLAIALVLAYRLGRGDDVLGTGGGDEVVATKSGVSAEDEEAAPDGADIARTLELTTEPSGAQIFEGEKFLGVTPKLIFPSPSEPVRYNLRLRGYKSVGLDFLGDMDEREVLHRILEEWRFPQLGISWENSLGMRFEPVTGGHESQVPVGVDEYFAFLDSTGTAGVGEVFTAEVGYQTEQNFIALTQRDVRQLTDWMAEQDRESGIMSAEHSYRAEVVSEEFGYEAPESNGSNYGGTLSLYRLKVVEQKYGAVLVSSIPSGAEVYREGVRLGETPLELPRVKAGELEFELRDSGRKTLFLTGSLEPDGFLALDAQLEVGEAIDFENAWENTLGMLFLPVEGNLMGAWEVRRSDFREFIEKSGYKKARSMDLRERPLHPVTRISREDAVSFCIWLTKRERDQGVISGKDSYRLPTDLEWSASVGLPMERGKEAAARNGVLLGVYPWGYAWPPPEGSGNFADVTFVGANKGGRGIEGYNDTYADTMPVDAVAADPRGLYHMSGNVWEMVSDRFGGSGEKFNAAVARGGSWRSFDPRDLLSSSRRPFNGNERADDIGFRCLLERNPGS